MILDNQEGRPLVPVTPTTAQYPIAGPAIPVVGYTEQPAGVAVEGGPALPVYLVSAGELAQYGLQAGPAVPMVLASAVGVTTTTGQRPIPVYLISGSLNPTPPAPPEIVLGWGLDSGPPFAPFVGAGALTAIGAVTTDTGIIGCAAEFDGANYLSTPDQVGIRCEIGWAVECWFRTPDNVPAGQVSIMSTDLQGGPTRNWSLDLSFSTPRAFTFDAALSSNSVATSGTPFPLNTWVHLVGAFGADNRMRLYVNGVLVATGGVLAGVPGATAVPVNIGRCPAGIQLVPAGARVDEPRIWQFGGTGDPGAAYWLARYNGGAGQSDRGAVAPCP